VLDLVVSHTSDQHPWFGRPPTALPFVAWYRFRSCPDDYAGFAGLRELPQLDLDHPEARAYVLDVVLPYWLDDVGVDGFRLDHVLGPSRDFWSELRRTVDERWPGTLLLGEVWADQRTIDSYRGRSTRRPRSRCATVWSRCSPRRRRPPSTTLGLMPHSVRARCPRPTSRATTSRASPTSPATTPVAPGSRTWRC
jgi:hypothetical protein